MEIEKKQEQDDGSGKVVFFIILGLIAILLLYKYVINPKIIEKNFAEYRIVTGYFSSLEIDGIAKKSCLNIVI